MRAEFQQKQEPREAGAVSTARALTGDGCWPRDELQTKGVGHLDHVFFWGWKDGLCPLRAAKDDGDIEATPARTNSRSSTAHLLLLEMTNK